MLFTLSNFFMHVTLHASALNVAAVMSTFLHVCCTQYCIEIIIILKPLNSTVTKARVTVKAERSSQSVEQHHHQQHLRRSVDSSGLTKG